MARFIRLTKSGFTGGNGEVLINTERILNVQHDYTGSMIVFGNGESEIFVNEDMNTILARIKEETPLTDVNYL